MSDLADQLIRQLSQLKSQRQQHEQVWRDCYRFTLPERGHGFQGTIVNATDAQNQRARDIFDSTAPDSVGKYGAAITAGLTPANSKWFELDAGQETEEERRWLDEAADFIFENIHGANFDAVNCEGHMDFGIAGWEVLYVDEAKEGGYHFELWPLSQCFISASKSNGLVDTIYRCWDPTIEQLVNEYGLDNVSDSVRGKYANPDSWLEKVPVCWAIYPRRMSVPGSRLAKNLPFASCHFEIGQRKVLRESGYHEFPCAVPRFRVIPESVYATGPASDALPDIKTLNDVQRLELLGMDIAITGMWKAVDDGVLNPKTVRLGPRKIVTMASLQSMEPLATGAEFKVAFAKADELKASIKRIFLADQLHPQDGPAMTATEVHARTALIRQQLGPLFGRMQAEYLAPVVTRCFMIAVRAGVLGQPPESLAGRTFTVKYASPLARAQKLEEVTAIDTFVAGQAQLMAVDPNAMDIVDLDEAARFKAGALGVPAKAICSTDRVTEKRKQRSDLAAQQQQQAVQQQGQAAMQQAAADRVAKAA